MTREKFKSTCVCMLNKQEKHLYKCFSHHDGFLGESRKNKFVLCYVSIDIHSIFYAKKKNAYLECGEDIYYIKYKFKPNKKRLKKWMKSSHNANFFSLK